MPINVEALSRLARISLENGDKELIEKKVNQVLEAFNKLNQVDTEGVEPFFHASPEMAPREDIPEAALSIESLMQNAPDSSESCFRIPKVVGDVE